MLNTLKILHMSNTTLNRRTLTPRNRNDTETNSARKQRLLNENLRRLPEDAYEISHLNQPLSNENSSSAVRRDLFRDFPAGPSTAINDGSNSRNNRVQNLQTMENAELQLHSATKNTPEARRSNRQNT